MKTPSEIKLEARHAARGHYAGQELQPNSTRPNSMDAYSLPSLVAGVRIARVMPICAPTTTKTTTSNSYTS